MGPAEHKTICFDLDGTLCNNTFGEYEQAEPFRLAIERVNALARAGHRIVIFTARGTATGIDWGETTRAQLERWGVSYDELQFGKPSADVYVDDRAVHTQAWLDGDAFTVPGLPAAGGSTGEEVPAPIPPHLSSVVEVGRTFGGKAFRADRHVDRLCELARAVGVTPPPNPSELRAAVVAALAATTSDEDVMFTISVTSAAHAAFAGADRMDAPAASVACRPVRHAVAGLKSRGLRRLAAGRLALEATTAGEPGQWPISPAPDGTIVDGMGGVLGVVRGDGLVLQEHEGPAQVAATEVAELGRALGLQVSHQPPTLEVLLSSDEVFVAGLPLCLVAITAIDGSPSAEENPVCDSLLARWGEQVGVDIVSRTASML